MKSIYLNLKAVFVFSLIVLNVIFFSIVFYLLIPLKLVLRGKPELILSRVFNAAGTMWIANNNRILDYVAKVKFTEDIPKELSNHDWYLVIANHRTWADIFLLQRVFNRRAPFLKFFLKKELMWVPIMGGAWWSLDFPFMKRYSKSYLKKNPHMKGKDMETTKKACEKFKYKPVAVMNFPEGTRNKKGKVEKLKSPYEKLIRPKAGGVSFALEAMDGKINQMVDVTICYKPEHPSLMDFLSGNIEEIHVEARMIGVEDWMCGSYADDMEYREKFQNFMNKVWEEKNRKLLEFAGESIRTENEADRPEPLELEN